MAAQVNAERSIKVYHGTDLKVFEVQLASGASQSGSPQELIYQQGTSVCLEVPNANPVWFTYSLGKVERPLGPSDADIAALVDLGKILTAFAPLEAQQAFQFGQIRTFADDATAEARREFPNLVWLITYTARLKTLGDVMGSVEEVRSQSERPEDLSSITAKSGTEAGGVGYAWAQGRIGELLPKSRVDGLEKEVLQWLEEARQGRDRIVKPDDTTKSGKEFLAWTEVTLNALKAYGNDLARRSRAISAEFAASGTWKDCAKLGTDGLTLRLTIKRKAVGTGLAYRATPDTVPIIAITPRYAWKTVDVVTGLGIVVTPGAHTFRLENGLIQDDGVETLVRPMVNVALPISPFGSRGQNAWIAVVGASVLDLQGKEKAGSVLGQLGLGVRLQDVFSLSTGVTFGSRPIRLKNGAAVGSSLPTSFPELSDAIQTASRIGVFFQVAFRGLTIKS